MRAEYFMRDASVSHSTRLIGKPDVSIILPTYCRGDSGLLKRAIESVLAQTFSCFELIVLDDGSVDSTADVIAEYRKADDRIIHVRHEVNCGLPALRVNEGLLMARGEFCAYQFDDDQWTNIFLERMARELRRNPTFEVAYGRCKWIIPPNVGALGGPFDYKRLVNQNYIANNTIFHRRAIFERLGAYDMHLVMRRLCDWDLWLRWSRYGPFLFVDELVSTVEAGKAGSIGTTCVLDMLAVRAHMAFDREDRLRLTNLKSYVLNDVNHLNHLGPTKLSAIWHEQIAPYQSRFRQPLDFPASLL